MLLRGKLFLPHESEILSLRTPTVYPSFVAYSQQWSYSASCLALWLWPNRLMNRPASHQRIRQSPKRCQPGWHHRWLPMVSILCLQCHTARSVRSGTTWRCNIFRQPSGTRSTFCSTESPDVIRGLLTPKTPMANPAIRSSRSMRSGAALASITTRVSCRNTGFWPHAKSSLSPKPNLGLLGLFT